MRYQYTYSFPIGRLTIYEKNHVIVAIQTEDILRHGASESYEEVETLQIRETKKQLEEYFLGLRAEFTIPIQYEGTEFQVKVWDELRKIPYGETYSYKDIAVKIGCPNGQRAVGMANNKNKLLIVVPCHRVIGKKGGLVGYAVGLDRKEFLLNLEAEVQE